MLFELLQHQKSKRPLTEQELYDIVFQLQQEAGNAYTTEQAKQDANLYHVCYYDAQFGAFTLALDLISRLPGMQPKEP